MNSLQFAKEMRQRNMMLESAIEHVEQCYEGIESLLAEFTEGLADKNNGKEEEDENEEEKTEEPQATSMFALRSY